MVNNAVGWASASGTGMVKIAGPRRLTQAWLTMPVVGPLRLTAIRRTSRSDTGMVNNAGPLRLTQAWFTMLDLHV